MKNISVSFPLSETEYSELTNKFENLILYAGWQLLKKNARNNHTDELEDIAQELRLSIVRAASYYKRQGSIHRCFDVQSRYIKDKFVARILEQLKTLWANRTRHGANKVV